MKAILDAELIDQLREVMEDDFGLLLETYLRESKIQLTAVDDAYSARDFEQLSKDAHRLKGSCSNIGANELASICAAIESDPGQDLTLLFDELHGQFCSVRFAIEELQQNF